MGGVCPGCKKAAVICDEIRGKLVCTSCGLVLEDRIINYHGEILVKEERGEKISRVGPPTTPVMFDKGLTTAVRARFVSRAGVGPRAMRRAYRLQRTARRSRHLRAAEKSLELGLSELQRVAGLLGWTRPTLENAAILFRKLHKNGDIRSRKIETVVAGLAFLVSNKLGPPHSLGKVAGAVGVDKKGVSRITAFLMRALPKEKFLPASAGAYIPRFASELTKELGITDEQTGALTALALRVVDRLAKRSFLSGRDPKGVAGAAIAIVLQRMIDEGRLELARVPIAAIARVAHVVPITVKARIDEVREEAPDILKIKLW